MDFFKGLDDIGEPMKKYQRGKHAGSFQVFTVATPFSGETSFGNLKKARSDFASNKKAKVPSHIGEYAWSPDGSMCDIVNAHGAYRSEELE